jgi:hypothetical protein
MPYDCAGRGKLPAFAPGEEWFVLAWVSVALNVSLSTDLGMG